MVQFRAIAAALALALLFLYLLPEPLQHLYTLSPRPVLSAGALAAGSAGTPLLDQPFVPDTLHSPPCQRPVYLYADLDLITELPFLTSVVLAGARDACGACVRLRQRIEFPIHVRAGLLDCSAFVLAATFEMSGDELEALRSRPALARERMLYMHLSDEHEDRSVEGYELPRLILRNYYSASPDRLVNISYLMDSASSGGGAQQQQQEEGEEEEAAARALWVPLGFAEGFMPHLSRALNLPSRDRPLAWSWAGSKDGKWARDYFLKGLEASPHREALMAAGRLHVYLKFMDGGMMKPIKYSSWLFESRVAPCPNGGSAEQFRVWESLLAGAIPIVPAGNAHLRYLRLLGFQTIEIPLDRWAEDPAPIMLAAASNDTFIAQLEGMQAVNAAVLRRVFHRLQARVAAEVCAAAGLPCREGVHCPRTHAPTVVAPQCVVE
jgi:hypothetical protein